MGIMGPFLTLWVLQVIIYIIDRRGQVVGVRPGRPTEPQVSETISWIVV